jgi:hypothetical protein
MGNTRNSFLAISDHGRFGRGETTNNMTICTLRYRSQTRSASEKATNGFEGCIPLDDARKLSTSVESDRDMQRIEMHRLQRNVTVGVVLADADEQADAHGGQGGRVIERCTIAANR